MRLVVVAYVVHYARARSESSDEQRHYSRFAPNHPSEPTTQPRTHPPRDPSHASAKPSVVCVRVSTIAIHPFYVHASAYSLVFIRRHNGGGGGALSLLVRASLERERV